MVRLSLLQRLRQRPRLLVAANVLFAVVAVTGQVAQNVTLPLWVGAAACSNSDQGTNASNSSVHNGSNGTGSHGGGGPTMDPFFVVSSASFSFVVIFGFLTLVSALFKAVTVQDLRFPQWQLFLIGFFDALNGILIVYSSPASRTAPFLQAILGNFLIPLTIFFRLVLLFKRPTLIKLLCATVVFLALVLSLVPVMTGLDQESQSGTNAYLKQSLTARVLWPLCFMIGFVPAALMNVVEEKSLKDTRNVNLFYLLFWSSVYQLLSVFLFFWTDLIPSFGYTNNIHEFGENYKFALKCFFGGAGCDYVPGLRGVVFIAMYVLSYIGGGLLLRYAEGATYLAVVNAVVTPLGALFWSLFDTNSCGGFFWSPHANNLTYFSIPGIAVMVPAIFIYNLLTSEEDPLEKQLKKVCCKNRELSIQADLPSDGEDEIDNDGEKSPLLHSNSNSLSYHSSTHGSHCDT